MGIRRLVRSPVVVWLAVIVLAAATGLTVTRLMAQAEAASARYGTLRSAVVAVRPAEIGAVLAPADVSVRQVPAAFLPEGSVSAVDDVVGRTVVVPVVPGQPVLRRFLAPEGLQGVAALLPPGTRGVAVPTGPPGTPLQRGDVVDVLATFDPSVAGTGSPTFPVAAGALVIDVGEESATVAVTPEQSTRVAFALTQGVITLAVSADRSPARPAPRPPPPPGTPRRG